MWRFRRYFKINTTGIFFSRRGKELFCLPCLEVEFNVQLIAFSFTPRKAKHCASVENGVCPFCFLHLVVNHLIPDRITSYYTAIFHPAFIQERF